MTSRSTLALTLVAVAGGLLAAPAAHAARYWTIRPAVEPPGQILWLGATPGSAIRAASLSTPRAGNHAQHWTMIGGNLTRKPLFFKNRQTGQCLDLQNTPGPPRDKNNLPVVLNLHPTGACYITAMWGLYLRGVGPLSYPASLRGTYELRNGSSGKCLGVPYFQYAIGTQLQQYTCTGSLKQQWRITGFVE